LFVVFHASVSGMREILWLKRDYLRGLWWNVQA
jgi:hypothetical protein